MKMNKDSKLRKCDRDEKRDVKVKDRFTDLPDAIAHHIMSFLTNVEDFGRLKFTSKRCSQLCLSIPSLTIDALDMSKKVPGSAKKARFMDFLISLIRFREGEELTNLYIRWTDLPLTSSETSRIMSMVNSALQCDLNHLDLNLWPEGMQLSLPLDLFYSESLTSLTVTLMLDKLLLPCPYGFSYLQGLHLNLLIIENEDFGDWISTFLKFLKHLILEQFSGVNKLKIASSSLKIINISSCSFQHIDISGQSIEYIWLIHPFESESIGTSVNISTPNILELKWGEFFTSVYSLGNMNMLQYVALTVCPGKDRMKSNSLLRTIAKTRHLSISIACIKVLHEDGCLPFVFKNLQSMDMYHFGLTDSIVPSLALFFQGLPRNMKKVYLGLDTGETKVDVSSALASGYEAEFWETRKFMFLDGLEEFLIDLVGGKNEEGLIEYVLKYATKLKKFVIQRSCVLPNLPTKIRSMLVTAGAARPSSNFRNEKGNLVLELIP